MTRNNATLTGLTAVVLWSSIVGLIRGVSESLGVTGGAAMIYSVATLFLLLSVGPTRVSQFPRRYLLWGSLLFVSYELCLALSIGYAHTSRQAIEVGMVNYLWPAFTMAAAILFNNQRANLLILLPGFVLAILRQHDRTGGASYFIPVLSAALAALVLQTSLSLAFWQGAAMVCIGSILCWLATRSRRNSAAEAVTNES